MSDAIMGAVKALRVTRVKLVHPPCQLRFRCFDKNMIMVEYQAQSMADQLKRCHTSANTPSHTAQPYRPVRIRQINVLTPIAARSDVVHLTG